MTEAPPAALADAIARLYDLDLSEAPGDVELYIALAQRTGGPIVELAVGTGRIAVPLALEGHRVVGVDLDAAMLARARTRIAAADVDERLELIEGEMTDAATNPAVVRGGPYRLAILALQSILILNTPERPEGRRRRDGRPARARWPRRDRHVAPDARRPGRIRRAAVIRVAAHGPRDRPSP